MILENTKIEYSLPAKLEICGKKNFPERLGTRFLFISNHLFQHSDNVFYACSYTLIRSKGLKLISNKKI